MFQTDTLSLMRLKRPTKFTLENTIKIFVPERDMTFNIKYNTPELHISYESLTEFDDCLM